MDKFKNYIKDTICGLGFLFAICSSTYCLSLILKKYIDSNSDFLFISFVICMIILSIIIKKNETDIKKNNEKIKKETTDTIFRIYHIKEKEEQ